MKPGLHTMPMAEYQADPAPTPSLSSGVIHRLVSQSPRHAWFAHPKLNPDFREEHEDKFDLGACAHAVLLEGEAKITPVEANDWRTKAAQDARDAARAFGNIPVLMRKMPEIRAMAEAAKVALRSLEELSVSLADGTAEQSIFWQDGETWCRARPDWMRYDRKLLLNYKTTSGSAQPNAWIRNQMVSMGYDTEAIHYLRGNAATGGAKDAKYLFMVQENYAPYECSFVVLSQAAREIAQRKWDFALALWRKCLARNKWPGYPAIVVHAEPSPWELSEDEELRLTFDERLEYLTV